MNQFNYRLAIWLSMIFSHHDLMAAPPAYPPRRAHTHYRDSAFMQPVSIQYGVEGLPPAGSLGLSQLACDRNQVVQVFSSAGLLIPSGGRFLHPGRLVPYRAYAPLLDRPLKCLGLYRSQFVYADDRVLLSNAWAGKLYTPHSLAEAKLFCGGEDFDFLVSDGISCRYLRDSTLLWEGRALDSLKAMVFDHTLNCFWLLGSRGISRYRRGDPAPRLVYEKQGLTCFALSGDERQLAVGTHEGYFRLDTKTLLPLGDFSRRLPCPDITVIREIGTDWWFGTMSGVFRISPAGEVSYYASRRWLPSDSVIDMTEGPDHSVYVLTRRGLAAILFRAMTLEEKALYYEYQVRSRHIRLGLNASLYHLKNGDPDTGSLVDSDNDGLWTSMYLGAEVFRYAATRSREALENCRESLDALERLYTLNSLKGFPSRSMERRGYAVSDTREWQHASHPQWDWKSTTSSDEAIGHMFAFGVIAELIDEPSIRGKAISLMDALMQHIVDNDLYMIDWNGKPTLWGKWNPAYVNARPKNVGDRKINSSNIISMLQTAYHFTGREIYRKKAVELLNKYGYLENLMRPMKEIGYAADSADLLSRQLSEGWNHSDDEMYFLGYWGLYRYAFSDTLKNKYRWAILDHWQAERPEKEAAWNLFTAITGPGDFDLEASVWYLKKYPLDLVDWKVSNSHRKDIDFLPPNFRGQTISEVLPPDELPVNRHNSNRFDLDGGDEKGGSEYSAGDIWLLPYWMGRYLRVISAGAGRVPAQLPDLLLP